MRDDLHHALVQVGEKIVQCLKEYQPDLEVEQALRLELDVVYRVRQRRSSLSHGTQSQHILNTK